MADSLKKLQNKLIKFGYEAKLANDSENDIKMRTGIFALDYVLDGGISQSTGGHRIEFFGAESSGKTTFTLQLIKQFQKEGKTCVFIDGEKSYDKNWAEILGIDNDRVLLLEPDTLEDAGEILVESIKQDIDLIVIDSIVSFEPKEETERDIDEPTMALQARINSLITRKAYNALKGKNTTIVFINQLREKVGQLYGNPHTTGGGRALRHFYSTRIQFRLGKPLEIGSGEKKERIGYEINLKCVKNKKGKPYRKAVIDFYFTGEIDNIKSLFFSAVKFGIIKRSGAWYEYKNIKAQGQEKLVAELTDKDWKEIEDEIWKNIK